MEWSGDKGKERKAEIQTDKQTNRQTDKQINRQTDKQTKRQRERKHLDPSPLMVDVSALLFATKITAKSFK
jgi:hypothetical protein